MRNALLGTAALIAASLAGIAPGHAQHWQGRGTWCIEPPMGGGIWECSYYSERQCRGTLTLGTGASCVPNPAEYWARRGEKIPPQLRPDYAKGRRTERGER
jgi:Protein of unknown function (DUF3551)